MTLPLNLLTFSHCNMPYFTPYPSFPLHVTNQATPVWNQGRITAGVPANHNDPIGSMPILLRTIMPSNLSIGMQFTRPFEMNNIAGMSMFHADTLAATSLMPHQWAVPQPQMMGNGQIQHSSATIWPNQHSVSACAQCELESQSLVST
jgi:hypothetical protein